MDLCRFQPTNNYKAQFRFPQVPLIFSPFSNNVIDHVTQSLGSKFTHILDGNRDHNTMDGAVVVEVKRNTRNVLGFVEVM